MSLDVYLTLKDAPTETQIKSGIFVREAGSTREISREEWDSHYPGREPTTVSMEPDDNGDYEVYTANITHNLNQMAKEAGIYEYLWRPEEIGVTQAEQLISPLQAGLDLLKSDPGRFKQYNPPNGWGSYEGLVKFVKDYLAACQKYPNAEVSVWR